MTTYNTDTFQRANVSGSWGTATDGTTWSHVGSATPNVTSNEGVVPSTPSNSDEFWLGTSHTDEEVLVRFSITSNVDTAMALLRYNSGSDQGYWMGYDGQVSSGHIYITNYNSGSKTTITSGSKTLTNGTFYWIRAQAISTNLKLRIWQDGNSEPSSWDLTATNSTYTSGAAGVVANSNGTGIKFDHFTSTSGATTTTVNLVDDVVSVSDASTETDIFLASDPLSVAETVVWNPAMAPVETLPETELLFMALVHTEPIDQNIIGATITSAVSIAVTDTLSVSESITSAGSPAGYQFTDVQLTVSDSITPKPVYVPTDSLSCSEGIGDTLTQKQTDTVGTLSDTVSGTTWSFLTGTDQTTITEPDDPLYQLILFALAASIADSATVPSDQTKNTGESRPTDSNTLSESFTSSTSTNVQLPDDPVSLSEAQQVALTTMGSELVTTGDALSYSIYSAIVGTDQMALPDDTLAFYNTPILIDTPLVASDGIVYSYSFIAANISGSKVYATDSFARTVGANGWGSASDGTSGSWTARTSAGMSYSVNGTAGVMSDTAGGSTLDMILGSQTFKDCDYLADVTFGNASDGTAYHLNVRADTGSQGIYIGFGSQTSFSINQNDGSFTTLGSKAISGITANTTYHVRARVVGTIAMGKYWQAGTAEPAAWTLQVTNVTLTAAGRIGVSCSPGSTGVTYTFDNVYVIDYPLADRATGSDAYTPTITAAPVDTLSASDTIVTLATDIVSLADIALGETESVRASIAYAATDTLTSPSDAGSFVSYPIGMYDANSTPISDFYSTSIATGESGSFSLTEAVAYNTVLAPTEQLIEAEQYQEALAYSTTELLALPEDRVAPLYVAPLYDDALVPSDNITATSIAAPVDILVSISSVGYGIFFTNIPEQSTTDDSVVFAYPIPLLDVPLTVVDVSKVTLLVPDLYALSQSEQYRSTVSQAQTNALSGISNVGAFALFSQIQDSDDALTITDSVIGGQPAFLNDTPLVVADTLDHGGYFPLSDAGDTLVVSESLYVLNNFTDIVVTQDAIMVTSELLVLDRRADQYSTIVSDHPSVYYQCNEDSFTGIFQKDGQDLSANASIAALAGAVLPYTWAQIEPQEGNYNWDLIDSDIAPWANQGKKVILRVFTAGTVAGNSKAHYNNTVGSATPDWVYSTYGARSVSETDGSVYPVYWDPAYQQKYSDFITAFGLRYDTSPSVAVVVASIGCFGQTSLDQSGNPGALALWQYEGYTPDLWTQTVDGYIQLYQQAFAHTPVALSVDSTYLVPDVNHDINTMISLAVKEGVWLEDDNVYVGSTHNNPNWNVVPVIAGQAKPTSASGDTLSQDLRLATLYRAYYATVATADITTANMPTLNTYANSVGSKILYDSGTGNVELTISDGIYPISHINPGDYLNGAQQCNGLTSYAYANQAAQTGTSDWTIKATIYPTVLPSPEAIVVANGREGYDSGGYALGIAGGATGGSGNNVCVFLPGVGWIDSGYALPQAMQWYSLMAVCSSGSLSFYVNGVQAPNITVCSPLAVPPMLTVGAGWDNLNRVATRYFIGSIDEIAVYPFALSPSRITALASLEIGMSDSTVGSGPEYLFFDQSVVDDSASTFTSVRTIIDTAPTLRDGLTYSLKTIADTYPVVLGQDNFNRLNQNGWGTASDGQVWQHVVGTSDWSIVSNQGQVTGAAVANYMLLGTTSGTMEEGLACFTIDDSGNGIGVCLRAQDGNNLYRARLYGGNFGIIRLTNGSATNLALSNPFTPSTGVKYWIRFRAYGSQLSAKYWAEPNPEPAAWALTTTDTNYTSGRIGIFAQIVNTGTTTVDNFYVVDNNLTDQLLVSESYRVSIAPPFAPEMGIVSDSMVWTELLQYADSGDQLVLVDTETINTQQRPIDFLQPVESFATALSFAKDDDPILSEVLLATMARQFDVDQLTAPTELAVPTTIMAPVDTLQPLDSQAEVLTANLLDPFAVVDATQLTQARSFSNQTAMGQDGISYTSIPLEVTQLVCSESVAYVLFDNPVTTTVLADAIMGALSNAASDSLVPSDNLVPTPVFGPADILSISELEASSGTSFIQDIIALTSDTLFDVETVAIADASTLSELISNTPAQQQIDTLSSVDGLADSLGSFLGDQTTASDTVVIFTSLTLPDAVTTSDAIIPTDQNWIADALLPADGIGYTPAWLELDVTPLSEGNLELLALMQTDVTPANHSNAVTLIYFFTTDISLTSDISFDVEAVNLADLVLTSDAAFNADILTNADQLFEVESLAAPGLFHPIDVVAVSDGTFEVFSESLMDGWLVPADQVSVQQANSFTGWVDLLYLSEVAQIAPQMAPVEQLAIVETTFYALREVLQGNSLALYGENLGASVALIATDSTVESERVSSSISSTSADQSATIDISALSSTFVPVEPLSEQESLQAAFALSTTDISVLTEQGAQHPLYAIVEQIGAVTEGVVLRVNFVPTEALSVIVQAQTSITEAAIDVLMTIDASIVQPVYQPEDIVVEAEAVAFAAQLKYSETVPLIDASTTTSIAQERGQLTLSPETDTLALALVPVEVLTQRDLSSERLALNFPVDTLAVLELDPSFGYGFTDSLYIQELLQGTSQSYMLVYGQVLSGQIDGTTLSGNIDGTVLSGNIDGVLS